jgi:hypothetical protein
MKINLKYESTISEDTEIQSLKLCKTILGSEEYIKFHDRKFTVDTQTDIFPIEEMNHYYLDICFGCVCSTETTAKIYKKIRFLSETGIKEEFNLQPYLFTRNNFCIDVSTEILSKFDQKLIKELCRYESRVVSEIYSLPLNKEVPKLTLYSSGSWVVDGESK